MRSSNPVFKSIERDYAYESANQATYRGITIKTLSLLIIAVVTGLFAIMYLPFEVVYGMMFVASIVALISVIIATRSPRLAMPFGILYSISEGLLLGVLTAVFEMIVPGVAFTAILITLVIFFVMLFLYSSRTIRVTQRFTKIMYVGLFSILLYFIIFGILAFFGSALVLSVMANPVANIIVGVIMIIFGSLMLTIDFDRAEMLVEGGADKRYEWIAAIGLMVTIIWIYIEVLRVVAIIASRRD